MNRRFLFLSVSLYFAAASSLSHAASTVDSCPAERYEPCSFFNASVALGQHKQIIDNSLAGYTRSTGSWTVSVRYQPETQCAKIDILLDTGPLDIPRQYREEFRNGAGEVSDSGGFMHKVDNVESALRILSSSCRVPYQRDPKPDTAKKSDESAEQERERLALDEERERLALEREREQLALEQEREKLALERERLVLHRELEAAQKRRRVEQERVRDRRRAEQQQERRLVEQVEQKRVRERIAHQQRVGEDTGTLPQGSALNNIITGLGLGALVGSAITGDDEAFDAAARVFSYGMGSTYVPSDSDSSTGSGCEQIGARLARDLERLSGSNSMCTIYRGTAQAYMQARNDLAVTGCATSQELANLDQAIHQAGAGARASCRGS